MNFLDITKNLPNGANMGSVSKLYYGLYEDVVTWPDISATPTSIEDYPVVAADIIMKAGKRMFEIYATPDTAELIFEPQGETDGMSFKVTLNFLNPGLQKKILGFMAASKNENLFFIVQDSEGQKYMVGDKYFPAKMQAGEGVTTGKATADRKGAGLSFYSYTNVPKVYTGAVPLTEASA